MNFNEYQKQARKTAIYPNKGNNFIYPVLGLGGEVGEVTEKIKKVLRDKNGIINNEDKDLIKKELGDVLWYLANLGAELDIDLNDVAETNLKKLLSRQERNQLHGNGDNR